MTVLIETVLKYKADEGIKQKILLITSALFTGNTLQVSYIFAIFLQIKDIC